MVRTEKCDQKILSLSDKFGIIMLRYIFSGIEQQRFAESNHQKFF